MERKSEDSKFIDEIEEAAAKHKEKLESLKEIAGSQKEKIFCLRNHRNELFDKIEKLNEEHETELKKSDETVATLQEENLNMKIRMSDSQEEIRVLNSKLEQLEKSKSCHQELVSIENELMLNQQQKQEDTSHVCSVTSTSNVKCRYILKETIQKENWGK